MVESGRAVAFGYNASGQLGVGTGFDEFVCVPTFVDDSLVVESEGQDYRFRSVSCGFAHSIFLSGGSLIFSSPYLVSFCIVVQLCPCFVFFFFFFFFLSLNFGRFFFTGCTIGIVEKI